MEAREFGKRSGLQIPRVSIGAMRLPGDTRKAIGLIRHAIDSGMRYIDTSRGYGESEWILGRALKNGYRDRVLLSTKWSPWISKPDAGDDTSAPCLRRRLEESMQRLDVDRLDFYQAWNIDSREHYEQTTVPGGMLEGIMKAREDGLVDHIGFTTHDSIENLLGYIEETEWCEAILCSYNLLSRTYAPAIEAAHRKGIGTLVMNPVMAGQLTGSGTERGELATGNSLGRLAGELGAVSIADLAIRYVLSNPHVDSILCGISKPSDVDDTISSAGRPAFTPEQMDRIEGFIESISPEKTGFCTQCGYCKPCPEGINIPAVMSCIQKARYWGLKDGAQQSYEGIRGPKAEACARCGECEERCTQHLKITEEMAWAASTLREKKE